MTKVISKAVLLLSVLALAACTSQEQEWQTFLSKSITSSDTAVKHLQRQIDTGLVKNTKLLENYANYLRQAKPELGEIIDALALDAKSSGPIFQGLVARLAKAKAFAVASPQQGKEAVEEVWAELDLIKNAASPAIYGMMLTDPLNVLADMSNGQLGRVEAMSKEAAAQANGAADMGAGSQLVGNPTYGSWSSGSGGNSFWVWYGQYALFSSLFRSPIYYGGWAGGRNYSYYHDYGRSHYTSPSQRKAQNTVNKQAKSKFQQSGKSFKSPYAKTKTGAARTVSKPRSSSRSGGFKSAYAKSSSARSSASRTSRSSRRGK